MDMEILKEKEEFNFKISVRLKFRIEMFPSIFMKLKR